MINFRKRQVLIWLMGAAVLCMIAGCGGGGASPSYATTAKAGTLTAITITPASPSIAANTHHQFTATGTYSNPSSTQDITNSVTWNSSNKSIATVNSNGLAAALSSAGSTTISATLSGIAGTTRLTVTTATLSRIDVTPTNLSIGEGATQQFTATGTFSDGTTQNITASVSWSSSNTGVATVNSAGVASGHAAGSSTITATQGSVSDNTLLTVTGTGTINLTWNAPTQYAGGSPLDPAADLKTYRIYYGTASHTYTQSQMITVSNPGTASVTRSVTLPVGTYFFVVTAITQENLESDPSNEISRTIY